MRRIATDGAAGARPTPAGAAALAAVPDPVPKAAPKLARYEQLDAFRLIVIAVITFHTYQHSTGPFGAVVPIGSLLDGVIGNLDFLLAFYFVMAGFGIAVQLFRPVLAGRPLPRTGSFVAKRLARLVPLYLFVFLLVWELRYAGTERQWGDFIWGITLMQSWSTEHIFATIDPAWYLSVEVGFLMAMAAVLLPVMRWISGWKSERSRTLGLVGIGVGLIVFGVGWKLGLAALHVPYDHWGRWFAPPSWMDLWGAGMLFGLAVIRWDRPDRWVPQGVPLALTVASLAWLWFLIIASDDGLLPRTLRWDAATVGMLGLMVAAVLARPERRTRRVMASAPIQTLGAWSFGMYIVHAPILRWLSGEGVLSLDNQTDWALSTVALVAVCALIGKFTLRFIEVPFQSITRAHLPERMRRWHEARPIKTQLRLGDPCPPLLREKFGHPEGPLVVLVTPNARLRPLLQGDASSVALHALEAERFIVEADGGRIGMLIGDDATRIERVLASEGIRIPVFGVPAVDLAKKLGVGGHTLRTGEVAPNRVVLVIDADGHVAGILQNVNGEELARDAVRLAAQPDIARQAA